MTSGHRDTPRVAPISTPDDAQREALAKTPTRPDGTVRNIFLTLAHHPMLLKRFNAFAGTFMRFGKISARERELIVLRVAGRIGSRYEYGQHIAIARDSGLSDDEILAVMLQPGAPELGAGDAVLMAMTDQLLATGDVEDATWAQLEERYEPDALIELLCIAGFYRMTGDVLRAARVQLEEPPELAIDWSRIERTA